MEENKINEGIKTYEELISFFSSLGDQIKDDSMVSISKKYVEDFKTDLNDLKKRSGIKVEDDKLRDDKTTEKSEEPEYLPYIRNFYESSYDNVNVRLDFEKLLNQFTEDMKNPNKALVETWINNYIDFVDNYKLDRDLMYKFIYDRFMKHENGKEYIPLLEELYNLDKEKDLTDEEKTLDNEKKTPVTEDETVEKTDTEEPPRKIDDESKKVDNSGSDEEKDEAKDDEEEKKVSNTPKLSGGTPLKIVSTKKTKLSKAEKIGLSLTAIMCMANISNPLFLAGIPITLGFIIHRLIKNYKYRNHKLEDYLVENGLNISSDGKLIDQDGNVITDTTVEKERYKSLKKQLTRMGAMKSSILPFSYMKNKLSSRFLESREERKQKREEKKQEKMRIKSELEGLDYLSSREREYEYLAEKYDEEYEEELEDENMMKKGLGRVR